MAKPKKIKTDIRLAWCSDCFTPLIGVSPQLGRVEKKKLKPWFCVPCQRYFSDKEVTNSKAFVSPWIPMRRAIDIKHIGKLGEELHELGAAICRCLIQGIDETEPTTGKINRLWLQEEVADVAANLRLIATHFNLDRDAITKRIAQKMTRLSAWHNMLAKKPGPSASASIIKKVLADVPKMKLSKTGNWVEAKRLSPVEILARSKTRKK